MPDEPARNEIVIPAEKVQRQGTVIGVVPCFWDGYVPPDNPPPDDPAPDVIIG